MSSLLFAGLTTLDLIHYARALPRAGTKGTADQSVFDVGGPAANAAITAAVLGGDVVLATVLGGNTAASYARDALSVHGIELREAASRGNLPVASVWVDGAGERTVLSTDNRTLDVESPSASFVGNDTKAVLLDGHYPELQVAIAKEAVANLVPIVLDCGRWRDVFADLLPLASAVIMSAGFRSPGTAELSVDDTIAAVASEYGLELCAITNGNEPIRTVTSDGAATVDVPQVDVVDTLGAGDVLHGAYLFYRYSAGLGPLQALREAAAVAASSCGHRGVRD